MAESDTSAATAPTHANVNPAEVAQFDRLAERWWDPTGEFKPLHDINPLRANWIDQHCPVAGLTGIDIGCGGGLLTEALAHRGAHMTGLDMSDKALGVAKQHLATSGLSIDYVKETAEHWAQKNREQYDFVTCLEMLEHVPDPASTVAACFDLVKPGGQVFFSTLNRNPKSFLFAIIGAEHILQMLPKGTHQYAQFIKPSELAHWIRLAGGEHQDLIGLTYNPLTKRYRLKKDVSVNYLMRSQKPDNAQTTA
jgi:2-polyprenyl-6-hydroxyphenyl methylase/3-demethylubiquinone-9 3-methyltransferase